MNDKTALQAETCAARPPTSRVLGDATSPMSEERFRSFTLFADSPDTARDARNLATSTLTDWGLATLADDARLVVSELVGNVVYHAVPDGHLASPGAHRRIDITLTKWPKWLFLGIGDEDSSPPTFPRGEPFSPRLAADLPEAVLPNSGRGMQIIHHLVDALWWMPEERGGKTVFCRFDLDTPAPCTGGRSPNRMGAAPVETPGGQERQ